MTKRSTKGARSVHALDQDIRRLRNKARLLEEQIDVNFTYLQQHSGSMFVRSLLPRKIEGEAMTGIQLLDTFLQNERLQGVLLRLADRIAVKLGDGLNWVIDRVFKK
ncbi:hypothetical protein ACQ86N_45945 [Puia sp. P3]|uniref:hypothetical protein n=1 Tax=Puia sp. P3 TaxID=3423952 RepID=UPI003D671A8C